MTELPATGGRDVHTVRLPAATPPATVDVLVVGAGPVGLGAAVELTPRGVRIAGRVTAARTPAPVTTAVRQRHHPRIGSSRFVFPAKDRRTALAAIGDAVHRAALRVAEHGAFPRDLDANKALRRSHSLYGHPEEIVAALGQEKVLPVATDLITPFNPAVPDHDAAIRALELITTEVAPASGWKPAQAAEPASAGV
ncbi:hypothetical protein ABZX30_26275 [Streptomyces sp. NPDC004542]|uniref:hypothetical protein n=1 Tax=Streptomyces sp. NPDC004542 TaxID=3154281 RepID=UPI0033B0FE6C